MFFSKKQKRKGKDGKAGAKPDAALIAKIHTLAWPAHKDKRLLIVSDGHSGHLASGALPPWFDAKPHTEDVKPGVDLSLPSEKPYTIRQLLENKAIEPGYSTIMRNRVLYELRRKCWDWLMSKLELLRPFYLLIYNGDTIDGKGPKTGGTELMTTDRGEQTDMGASSIDEIAGGAAVLMSYGTGYHVGLLEDWENEVAHKAKNVAKIGGVDWVKIYGKTIGYRHHCGRSSIPHGVYTLLAKERLWEMLWAERGEYPESDILVRSHVHYHCYCGGPGFFAMTTPALQAYGAKINRRVLGVVDFGFSWIDFQSNGDFRWYTKTCRLHTAEAAVIQA